MFFAQSIAEFCDCGTKGDLIDSLREGHFRPVVFRFGGYIEDGRFGFLGLVEQPGWDSVVLFGKERRWGYAFRTHVDGEYDKVYGSGLVGFLGYWNL
jgi:hypothetical protein